MWVWRDGNAFHHVWPTRNRHTYNKLISAICIVWQGLQLETDPVRHLFLRNIRGSWQLVGQGPMRKYDSGITLPFGDGKSTEKMEPCCWLHLATQSLFLLVIHSMLLEYVEKDKSPLGKSIEYSIWNPHTGRIICQLHLHMLGLLNRVKPR